ncbi:hypothetical protein HMF8227_00209 [Saliniradius amylolyticus]|uniref:Phospholipase C/D domain-containing protein n=1 Tax=Saliniradius amylolyticus TaxID=2183582 RepID=A0A2S2E110_9ALTE|nr:hypothetical protein [Saliniradius amylolyticus]AWL10717.1 hypothetical protein HMF8227_00209 [Saliniradius amylolyticus]
MSRGLLLTFITILFAASAFAYKPESGHEPLTNVATEIYQRCFTGSHLARVSGWRARLVEGNRAMDEGLGFDLVDWLRLNDDGVFSLWRRSVNWHFYHPERTHHSRALLVEQSLERLWQDLKQGLEKHRKPYHKLMFAGGLMHFIEDMTVPAHVVPVYHGPTLIEVVGPFQLKPLVDYMQAFRPEFKGMIIDAVDKQPVQSSRIKSQLLEDTGFCQQISHHNPKIDTILRQTARQTLHALQQAIPDCPQHRWQDFWQPPEGEAFFGRYAVYHQDGVTKNPLFGEAGALENAEGRLCLFEKEDVRYKDFLFARQRDAVEADLRVLNWVERQLSR